MVTGSRCPSCFYLDIIKVECDFATFTSIPLENVKIRKARYNIYCLEWELANIIDYYYYYKNKMQYR